MPRFSAEVKEVSDQIWYHTDIDKAKELLDQLKDPLDITIGKLFISLQYIMFQELEKLLEILKEAEIENLILKDHFIQFLIDNYYCIYYMGLYNPMISKEQTEKYLDKIEQGHQNIDYHDDWEKFYCYSWYYYTKSFFEWRINNNLANAIEAQKRSIDAFSRIPEEGKYNSDVAHINLGIFQEISGNFEDAEKSYNLALASASEYGNLYQFWCTTHLTRLYFQKGNLQGAKELNIQGLDVSRKFNNVFGISSGLSRKGFYLFEEGSYDDALKAYQENLTYRKQNSDVPYTIFFGYYNIFAFYYDRFKLTKDKAFLAKAEKALIDLQEMGKTHSDNKAIVNYTNFAHALVLKFGNIRKKGKAIDILEGLIEFYPNEIGFSLNLLELLFEDVIQSEDQDTINQIDGIMEKIGKIPLRNNPKAIFRFISQQIFLAKYSYYIKGDPSIALNILNEAKDRINTYKLDNLVNQLNAEIQVLESEITKWEHLDKSVKDRIKASKFNDYIQQALIMIDKQK